MVASDIRALRAAESSSRDDETTPDTRERTARHRRDDADEEAEDDDQEERPLLPLVKYGAAIALFLVVASPSWVPRLVFTGNPVYHGYLPNYLWVDDYQQAHMPGPPRYSWSTYWEDHTIADAAGRLGYGIARVYWQTPREKIGEGAALVTAIAIVALVLTRDEAALWLVLAAILQALPLAWTAMSNDTRRVPAAALLPFIALLTAAAAARCIDDARKRSAPVRGAGGKSKSTRPAAPRPSPTQE